MPMDNTWTESEKIPLLIGLCLANTATNKQDKNLLNLFKRFYSTRIWYIFF